MSDTHPITLQSQAIKQPSEQIIKDGHEHIKKQSTLYDERPVVLSIETPQKEKPDNIDSEKTLKGAERLKMFKDVKTVMVSYSDEGSTIVKFIDSKGNVVLQIPPEEYLRLKEESKTKTGEKVPDIVNKKV